MSKNFYTILLLVATSTFLVGCYSYTGVPAHGGGKRFYEEQKLIASSIQKACDKIDTHILEGKKVEIILVSMETSGGAQITYPSTGNVNLGYGVDVEFDRSDDFTDFSRDTSYGLNPNGNLLLNPQTQYRPFFNRTSDDVNYLRKAVEMRMQTAGVQLVPRSEAEITLNVLVNALGTKSSALSAPLKINESLEASCDLTYYAVNRESNEVVMSRKRASSIARYEVKRRRFSSTLDESYSLPEDNGAELF